MAIHGVGFFKQKGRKALFTLRPFTCFIMKLFKKYLQP